MAGKYNCTLCDKHFTAKSSLKNHVQSVHRREVVVCRFCRSTVKADMSNVRRHEDGCKRNRAGNGGRLKCFWHGCNYNCSRSDNMKRHMRKCRHKPTNWAGGYPNPVRNNGQQVAPTQGQEAPALAQGTAVTPQTGVNAFQQGIDLAPGDPTNPVWFAANYPQFDGYWQPAAAYQSPAAAMPANVDYQVVEPEWNASENTPLTDYGLVCKTWPGRLQTHQPLAADQNSVQKWWYWRQSFKPAVGHHSPPTFNINLVDINLVDIKLLDINLLDVNLLDIDLLDINLLNINLQSSSS
ncbi:uncharacterized protein Z520_12114 [Fonsecaea multimorphosa CBS 102226]|uniref:C2H2-type domain-containing protein n=1 Tax=Fonsecaea multimorphosa CBS 102226 TaxID=1442371 RepID=A0A0D2K7B2_9EURO|nr:uncharacterized protein Z520_12114 [Fonsecaea multimorphosa CBS 102226]KIX92233.1 hypothetical protein Z520_12114 [Fonsecaea multimorphosa CBS 102226]